jgi:hypothetical protein
VRPTRTPNEEVDSDQGRDLKGVEIPKALGRSEADESTA